MKKKTAVVSLEIHVMTPIPGNVATQTSKAMSCQLSLNTNINLLALCNKTKMLLFYYSLSGISHKVLILMYKLNIIKLFH